ncbi:MAG: serine/threonine protein kinase [Myxococcales bacterium]|nr:MAG: serine/threonine protein kinase [Myxococcales bacterium]
MLRLAPGRGSWQDHARGGPHPVKRTEALDAIPAARSLRPGDVLAGKFRVERVLGQGGMGLVVAAHHLHLDQRVAIKLLLPHSLRNPEVVARFAQEARSMVQIHSEHVVRVLDVGNDDGTPYIVMEHLEGHDLLAELKARGPLPLGVAVDYVLQACEALAEAHRLGIVHRDLKPANLFLTRRADGSPLVKVLDFGISKAALATGASGGASGGITVDSSVMGSPNYMSPEQLKNSKDVDARADVWSLGLVLYELLTGTVAFQAETLVELHMAILQSFPVSLARARPDLPPGVELLVLRCLHKDRAFRFASVAEMARALGEFAPAHAQVSIERVCRVLGVSPTTAPPSTGPGTSPPASWGPTSSPWAPTSAPGSSSPAWSSSFAPPYPSSAPVATPPPLAPPAWQPPGAAPLLGPTGPTSGLPNGAWPSSPAAPTGWNGPAAPLAPARSGSSTALIVLAIVVGIIAVSGVGCVACVGLIAR